LPNGWIYRRAGASGAKRLHGIEFDGAQEELAMKVRESMTKDVVLVNPGQTVAEAARLMIERDIGAIPVGDNDKLVGMLTDRDIAVRVIAQGKGPDTLVSDAMSQEVMYCFEDEDLNDVASNMGDIRVRRLPVVSRDKRLVGIVSIGDVAACEGNRLTGRTVAGISTPGGAHSQSTAH
jgi:CBS domain-containing protein